MLPEFEVFAIKYGERLGVRGDIFMKGDPHDTPMAMDYYIWVIRNEKTTIIVDCGFSKDEGESRGRTYLRSPAEGLELGALRAGRRTPGSGPSAGGLRALKSSSM